MAWIPINSQWRNLRKAVVTHIFAPQRLDATQALRLAKIRELLDHVNQSCKSGAPIDIGRVVLTTVLNAISNTFFSIDLAQYDSNLSHEFQDLVCGVTEEAGRPNIADYFPALRLIDPQGVRKRVRIYFSKVFGIFDGIIKERLQLRASSKGSKGSNDVLDSFLSLTEEDNSEISLLDIKHLLLVIDYLFKTLVQSAMIALIATALGLETLVWPSVLITTSIVFVLALKLDLIVSSSATVEFRRTLGKSKNLFSRDFAIGFTKLILIVSFDMFKSIGWIFIDKGMISVIKNHEKILNSTSNLQFTILPFST
nr:geraniol 8-hydroxylase [Quercus suber]